jgi:hypothetical protein
VKLDEVQRLDAQVAQAALDKGGQILPVVAICHVGRQAAACLGGDIDALTLSLAQDLGNQLFAAAIAINIGSVDKVDAQIEGLVQCL